MSTDIAPPPPAPVPSPPQPPSVSSALGRAFGMLAVLALVIAVVVIVLSAWHISQTTVERDRNVYLATEELVVDLQAERSLTVNVHDRDEIIVESREQTMFRSARASETVDGDALRLASEPCGPIVSFGWMQSCDASYDVTVPA